MIRDLGNGEVGFVLPLKAGVHYRNLVLDYVPRMEEQLRQLEKLSIEQSA